MVAHSRSRVTWIGEPIGAGVTDGRLASVPVVLKTNCIAAPYCIANELVCGGIGRFLGLPIPAGAVCHSNSPSHQLGYVSLNINLLGDTLPPVNVTLCAKQLPDLSTGVLLFDVLIGNADRHGRNLSVDWNVKPPVMSIFDHGHALFGKDAGQAVHRLEMLRNRLGISGGSRTRGNRHCMLDQIDSDTYFGLWFERIHQIPGYVIDDLCDQIPTLGCKPDEAKAAAEFLKYRRTNIESIVLANKAEFTKIKSWRLFQ
jgi:hypothetical protein